MKRPICHTPAARKSETTFASATMASASSMKPTSHILVWLKPGGSPLWISSRAASGPGGSPLTARKYSGFASKKRCNARSCFGVSSTVRKPGSSGCIGRPQGDAIGEELGAHHAVPHRRIVLHQLARLRLRFRVREMLADDPLLALGGAL